MLECALLLLVQAASQGTPLLKAEARELPAQGASAPGIAFDGTSNLPDGSVLNAYLYYGRVDEGKALARDSATVTGGKFTQDFIPFRKSKKNFPGTYIARFSYNPGLQIGTISGFDSATIDVTLVLGTAEDLARESDIVRNRLVGEIREIVGCGDEVKLKLEELKGKPASEWKPSLVGWSQKTVQIMGRAMPINVPEYTVLKLDLIADSGLETLCGILNSAARYAAAGHAEDALEGLTRLRQTATYWEAEIVSPKLTSPQDLLQLVESARKLIAETLAHPDLPVLPARRKFVEMNALLQKSLPEDFQATVLEIGTCSTSFFNAVADKDARAKELHEQLDRMLEKLAAKFRPPPK